MRIGADHERYAGMTDLGGKGGGGASGGQMVSDVGMTQIVDPDTLVKNIQMYILINKMKNSISGFQWDDGNMKKGRSTV